MTTLMDASRQWATRPDDERFLSLLDLEKFTRSVKENSGAGVRSTKDLEVVALSNDPTGKALAVRGPAKNPIAMTYWAFGQACQRAAVPASYARTLPATLASANLNYGLKTRADERVQILVRQDPVGKYLTACAMTGPDYGRIWNADIVSALVRNFGDGTTGHFRVPGEFGKKVPITKSNTTLYASDQDMFVFLADEERRIEVPNRRDGKTGSMARGFFVKNSEVGAGTAEIIGFLFDYVCCNRIVWGAQDVVKVKIRHTSHAPGRWIDGAVPALQSYVRSSIKPLEAMLGAARTKKIDDVEVFLKARKLTNVQITGTIRAHVQAEQRPIETLWDASVGITEYAKTITWQDDRVALEKVAGKVLEMAI